MDGVTTNGSCMFFFPTFLFYGFVFVVYTSSRRVTHSYYRFRFAISRLSVVDEDNLNPTRLICKSNSLEKLYMVVGLIQCFGLYTSSFQHWPTYMGRYAVLVWRVGVRVREWRKCVEIDTQKTSESRRFERWLRIRRAFAAGNAERASKSPLKIRVLPQS